MAATPPLHKAGLDQCQTNRAIKSIILLLIGWGVTCVVARFVINAIVAGSFGEHIKLGSGYWVLPFLLGAAVGIPFTWRRSLRQPVPTSSELRQNVGELPDRASLSNAAKPALVGLGFLVALGFVFVAIAGGVFLFLGSSSLADGYGIQ